MSFDMCKEAKSLYDLGYRVVKTAESKVPFPRGCSPNFLKLLKEDRLWYVAVPCNKGRKIAGVKAHIYFHGPGKLAYCGVGSKLRKSLLNIPSVKAHQTGDEEFSVVFHFSALSAVAALVQPCLRRNRAKSIGSDEFSGVNSIEGPGSSIGRGLNHVDAN